MAKHKPGRRYFVKKGVGRLHAVREQLETIEEISGQRNKKTVRITIRDIGATKSENPAFYGALLESGHFDFSGRDYTFMKPALADLVNYFNKDYVDFMLEVVKTNNIKKNTPKKSKSLKTKIWKKEMKLLEKYGKLGVDKVINYIINMRQYPLRKRKNRTLISNSTDTIKLINSICYEVVDSKGRILRRGQ